MASNGWATTTIGRLVDSGAVSVQTGPFGSQLHAHDYEDAGVPVVATESIGRRRLVPDLMPRIAPSTALRLARHRLAPGDIVFARRGVQATGLSAIVEPQHDGFICGTGALRLRVHEQDRLHPEFLSFFLAADSTFEWLRTHAVGAVMPNLNEDVIRGLPITLPPIGEQRAIAAVLGALDDKIGLNRRVCRTLEGIARAVFQSWFVDFDPVRAKAAGAKRFRGMPQAVFDTLPAAFTDSPLGTIPKGWRVAALAEHIAAMKGLSYKGSGLCDAGVPLHNLNSVYEGGGYKYEGIKHYDGEYRDRHIIRPGDIIVTNTEQGHDLLLIGFPALVPRRFGDWGLFSHHLFRVRPKPESPVTRHFMYFMLMTPRVRDEITGHTNGTTVNMLSVTGLQMPLVVIPPRAVLEAYEAIASPLLERAEQTHDQSPTLAAIRDALLPKLVTGEIRLERVRRRVGAVRSSCGRRP